MDPAKLSKENMRQIYNEELQIDQGLNRILQDSINNSKDITELCIQYYSQMIDDLRQKDPNLLDVDVWHTAILRPIIWFYTDRIASKNFDKKFTAKVKTIFLDLGEKMFDSMITYFKENQTCLGIK